jgi:hypothetical protein
VRVESPDGEGLTVLRLPGRVGDKSRDVLSEVPNEYVSHVSGYWIGLESVGACKELGEE